MNLFLFLCWHFPLALCTACSTYNGGKIFCFGDELTAGISHQDDEIHTPYATSLQTLLPSVHVSESSVNGEFTYHMRRRWESELIHHEFTSPSVIVLWGGVNDISKHVKINTTVKHIIAMHDYVRYMKETQPLKYGGILHTILVTIPQLKSHDLNREKRLKVNTRLREYAAGTNNFVLVLDLEDVFRYAKYCHSHEKSQSSQSQPTPVTTSQHPTGSLTHTHTHIKEDRCKVSHDSSASLSCEVLASTLRLDPISSRISSYKWHGIRNGM